MKYLFFTLSLLILSCTSQKEAPSRPKLYFQYLDFTISKGTLGTYFLYVDSTGKYFGAQYMGQDNTGDPKYFKGILNDSSIDKLNHVISKVKKRVSDVNDEDRPMNAPWFGFILTYNQYKADTVHSWYNATNDDHELSEILYKAIINSENSSFDTTYKSTSTELFQIPPPPIISLPE